MLSKQRDTVMVAAGRIRFSPLIVLIVVLSAVAKGHVVKRDVTTSGYNGSATGGLPTTAYPGQESSSINYNSTDTAISEAEKGNNILRN